MNCELLRNAMCHPTSWVFLAVLVAGLLMGIARANPPLDQGEIVTLIALSKESTRWFKKSQVDLENTTLETDLSGQHGCFAGRLRRGG